MDVSYQACGTQIGFSYNPERTASRTQRCCSTLGRLWGQCKAWKKQLVLFLAPVLFLPLVLVHHDKKARAAYIIFIMASYWIVDVTHVAPASFLPIILFPAFGIIPASDLCRVYFDDINILFISGLIMAVAMESWNLHKRIALRMILLTGSHPRRIILGFMLVTAFMSLWMSNTATSGMMTPLATAVLTVLESKPETKLRRSSLTSSNERTSILNTQVHPEEVTRFGKALMLSIAFSANVGGVGTLTGSGPNIVFGGQVERLFGEASSVSFLSWFVVAFPITLLFLLLGWLVLNIAFLRFRLRDLYQPVRSLLPVQQDGEEVDAWTEVHSIIQEQYDSLGKMKFAEIAVLAHLIFLVLVWFFREPKFMPGWSELFQSGYITDGSAGLFVVFILFVFPSEKPKVFCWNNSKEVTRPPPNLLTWSVVAQKFPWHIFVLVGGGLAMAEGAHRSGLSAWLGCRLAGLHGVPPPLILLLVCLLTSALTEVTSNVATASLLLPIAGMLADGLRVHPYYLMFPVAVSCSFAFMLPVATPPNAIAFTTGRLTVAEMVRCGICMDLVGIGVVMLAMHTWGGYYFQLDRFPSWAELQINGTLC